MPQADDNLEAIARKLEESPDYRVLRKIKPRRQFNAPTSSLRTAAILDLETTGLDIAHDELIEIAILKFQFSEEDEIIGVVEEYSCLNEPVNGIPEEITSITGISNLDVAGRTIDPNQIENLLDDVSVVIAHNAQFDRPITERYLPSTTKMNWACSATEIDWKSEGIGSAKLEHLLSNYGYFYDSHRAITDCQALLQLLSMSLPKTGRTAFAALLERARRPSIRIFADGAPFETKEVLKKRGYRWSDGTNSPYKAWWKDFSQGACEDEIEFLKRNVLTGSKREIPTVKMSAQSRFKSQLDR